MASDLRLSNWTWRKPALLLSIIIIIIIMIITIIVVVVSIILVIIIVVAIIIVPFFFKGLSFFCVLFGAPGYTGSSALNATSASAKTTS